MLGLFGTCLLAVLASPACITAQSWKHYPLVLENNPDLTFPEIEGPQYQDSGDSWFLTAQVQGQSTGKTYQLVNIFDRNTLFISEAKFDFYEVSIFDYETGNYATYTDYDVPAVNLVTGVTFSGNAGSLDIAFASGAGNATWANQLNNGNLVPFEQNLYCPGTDKFTGQHFGFNISINYQKSPVAYGASTLRGFFEFYGQQNTLTYFQTAPQIFGSITYAGVTEQITGTIGHFDRQIFPQYSGIDTPTGRQHSHEWSQVHLSNGVDISIWRQYDRVNNNTVIPTTGITTSPGDGTDPGWQNGLPNDLTVEYINYSKYPRGEFSTLIPPPSANMWMPSEHIVRSTALGLELHCTYVNPVPAVTLPIEYFECPAHWVGTYQGANVTGIGIYESTFALYRDWELATVLYNSVVHLSSTAFNGTAQRTEIVEAVAHLQSLVSDDPADDDRTKAAAYNTLSVMPLLKTLNGPSRAKMLEIAEDFQSSLSLVLQF